MEIKIRHDRFYFYELDQVLKCIKTLHLKEEIHRKVCVTMITGYMKEFVGIINYMDRILNDEDQSKREEELKELQEYINHHIVIHDRIMNFSDEEGFNEGEYLKAVSEINPEGYTPDNIKLIRNNDVVVHDFPFDKYEFNPDWLRSKLEEYEAKHKE